MLVTMRQPTRSGNNVHFYLYIDAVRVGEGGLNVTPVQYNGLVEVFECARDHGLMHFDMDALQ